MTFVRMSASVGEESTVMSTEADLSLAQIDLDGIVDEDVQTLGRNLHGSFHEIMSSSLDYMNGVKQRLLDDKVII